MNPTCIYHGNCPDGFTAAWIVKGAMEGLLADGCDFHPGVYGEDPPNCSGRSVYMVDFTYGPDQMHALSKAASNLVVLDHHQTAIANCAATSNDSNTTVHLDMNRSGARITWDYFYGDEQPPDIVSFVEDRDLWRWALDGTKDYFAALTSRPYTFEAWDEAAATPLAEMLAEGRAINRYRDQLIDQAVATAAFAEVPGAGWMPVVNCPYAYASDVAGILAADARIEMLPDPDPGIPLKVAAYYFDNHAAGVRSWGLRSTEDGPDVAKLAEKNGGGGHKHAAGFRTELP
jgi:hypothetical protein